MKSLQISLIAPVVLSSRFIKLTEQLNVRRKIINISSGAGTYPLPDMSIYCSAKAGLNMFTRCVGAEQANKDNPVEIVAVDPGMVDTKMQQTARELESEKFAMADFFKKAFADGQLQSPEKLAKDMKRIIEMKVETGRIMCHSEE